MIRLQPLGAEALLLTLAEHPDEHLPLRIAALARRMREQLGDCLTDVVPGWTTLLLQYDLLRIDLPTLLQRVQSLLADWDVNAEAAEPGRLHEIPVWYCGE